MLKVYLDAQDSRYSWMHRIQGIPGCTGFKGFLRTYGSRFTWMHRVQSIPGYTGFKVYLDTQGLRYTWIHLCSRFWFRIRSCWTWSFIFSTPYSSTRSLNNDKSLFKKPRWLDPHSLTQFFEQRNENLPQTLIF